MVAPYTGTLPGEPRARSVGAMLPQTRYARLRSERIAYQVLGEGPRDLVLTTGSFSNGEIEWEDPTMARLLMRLASFARVIRFDRRGTGTSDPVPIQALPPWESYVEELVAVMDAVGSEVATVMAVFDAGPLGMVFAATKPERTAGLILANTAARFLWADDHPFGTPREVADQLIEQVAELWGTEALVWIAVPSRAADERYRRWHARLQRAMASPSAVQAYLRALFDSGSASIQGDRASPRRHRGPDRAHRGEGDGRSRRRRGLDLPRGTGPAVGIGHRPGGSRRAPAKGVDGDWPLFAVTAL
jgi:pimeloyl-ACP methyl ester carboxylesterase